jgi:hypothetical protein
VRRGLMHRRSWPTRCWRNSSRILARSGRSGSDSRLWAQLGPRASRAHRCIGAGAPSPPSSRETGRGRPIPMERTCQPFCGPLERGPRENVVFPTTSPRSETAR